MALQNPAVTIMMPAYNAAKYIAGALKSVLTQDCGDFEIIVIDDGSTDRTYQIVERFRSDFRLRLYRNGSRLGIAATRNKILSLARGFWVVAHDADDIMLPGRLSAQLGVLRSWPNLGGVFGLVIRFLGKEKFYFQGCRGINSDGRLREGVVRAMPEDFCHSTCMVRKDLLLMAGGYDFFLPNGEDLRLFRRLFAMAPFYFLNRFSLINHKHSRSASAVYETTRRRFLKEIFINRPREIKWQIKFNKITIPLEACDPKSRKLLLWRFNLYAVKSKKQNRSALRIGGTLNEVMSLVGKRFLKKGLVLVRAALLSSNGNGILIFFADGEVAEIGNALLSFIRKGYAYHSSGISLLELHGGALHAKGCVDPLAVKWPKRIKSRSLLWNPVLRMHYLAMDLYKIGSLEEACSISKMVVLKTGTDSKTFVKKLDSATKEFIFRKNIFFDGSDFRGAMNYAKAISKVPGYEVIYNRKKIERCAAPQGGNQGEALRRLRDL